MLSSAAGFVRKLCGTSSGSTVNRDRIVWAYRLFLDREPESEQVVQEKLSGPAKNPHDLRREFLLSAEFAKNNPEFAPMPNGTFVIKVLPNGCRLFVDLSDQVIGAEVARGTYEPDAIAILEKYVRPGMNVLDVGANIGYYTIPLANLVGTTGRVFAFEPVTECSSLLRRSLDENRFTGRVTVEESAVGASPGSARILVVANARNKGASHLVREGFAHALPHELRTVPVAVLDDYPLARPIGFAKMDIEGAEPFCIRGARRLLEKDRPVVLSELHPAQLKKVADCSPDDYLAEMRAIGYGCFRVENGKAGSEISGYPAVAEPVSVLFLPRSG